MLVAFFCSLATVNLSDVAAYRDCFVLKDSCHLEHLHNRTYPKLVYFTLRVIYELIASLRHLTELCIQYYGLYC